MNMDENIFKARKGRSSLFYINFVKKRIFPSKEGIELKRDEGVF
jgi:hypothetical protein